MKNHTLLRVGPTTSHYHMALLNVETVSELSLFPRSFRLDICETQTLTAPGKVVLRVPDALPLPEGSSIRCLLPALCALAVSMSWSHI